MEESIPKERKLLGKMVSVLSDVYYFTIFFDKRIFYITFKLREIF